MFLHLVALHTVKSNNPLGIDIKGPQDTIPFHPYYTIKDLFGLGVFLMFYLAVVFYAPNFFGEPFYAILRAVPDIWFIDAKLAGVILMFGSIIVLFFLPWLDTSKVRSAKFRPLYTGFFWIFLVDCLVLGYIGGKPAEGIYIPIGQAATVWYFAHFLLILPLVGKFEKTRPLPQSIAQPVLKGAGSVPTGATAQKMEKA